MENNTFLKFKVLKPRTKGGLGNVISKADVFKWRHRL